MELLEFIPNELLIVIVATNVLGVFLKKFEGIKDKYIVPLLMIFSILFSMLICGFNTSSFLQGILSWGVAVGLNQTIKQTLKEE